MYKCTYMQFDSELTQSTGEFTRHAMLIQYTTTKILVHKQKRFTNSEYMKASGPARGRDARQSTHKEVKEITKESKMFSYGSYVLH